MCCSKNKSKQPRRPRVCVSAWRTGDFDRHGIHAQCPLTPMATQRMDALPSMKTESALLLLPLVVLIFASPARAPRPPRGRGVSRSPDGQEFVEEIGGGGEQGAPGQIEGFLPPRIRAQPCHDPAVILQRESDDLPIKGEVVLGPRAPEALIPAQIHHARPGRGEANPPGHAARRGRCWLPGPRRSPPGPSAWGRTGRRQGGGGGGGGAGSSAAEGREGSRSCCAGSPWRSPQHHHRPPRQPRRRLFSPAAALRLCVSAWRRPGGDVMARLPKKPGAAERAARKSLSPKQQQPPFPSLPQPRRREESEGHAEARTTTGTSRAAGPPATAQSTNAGWRESATAARPPPTPAGPA